MDQALAAIHPAHPPCCERASGPVCSPMGRTSDSSGSDAERLMSLRQPRTSAIEGRCGASEREALIREWYPESHRTAAFGQTNALSTETGSMDMRHRIRRHVLSGLAAILAASFFSAPNGTKAVDVSTAFEGEKTTWPDGSARYDFVMDDQTHVIKPFQVEKDDKAANKGQPRCIVVVPKRAAAGNPWSWRDLHRDHQPQTEVELLARGFHCRLHHARTAPTAGCMVRLPDRETWVVPQAGLRWDEHERRTSSRDRQSQHHS